MSNAIHVDKTTKTTKALQRVKGDTTKLRDEITEQALKDTEDVLAAGQEDSRKAVKEVERIETRDMKEEAKARDEILNSLDMKKRFQDSYKTELAKQLSEMLMMLDWIRGWSAEVIPTKPGSITIKGKQFTTKEGILLVVVTAKGNVMHQGMLVTGEPTLDYAGLYNLCLTAENTMDKARGLLLTHTNGGGNGIVGKDGQPLHDSAILAK